jgi:hypothetical protein
MVRTRWAHMHRIRSPLYFLNKTCCTSLHTTCRAGFLDLLSHRTQPWRIGSSSAEMRHGRRLWNSPASTRVSEAAEFLLAPGLPCVLDSQIGWIFLMPLVDFGLAACFARIGIGWIMDGDADPVALGSRALATRRVYLFHYLPLSFLWGRRSSTDADDGLVILEKAPSGRWQGWRTPSLTSRLSMAPRCRPRVSSPGSQYRYVQNSVVTNLCKIHKNHKYRSKFDFQIWDGRIRYDPNLSILSINQSILPVYRYRNAKTSKGCLA